MRYKFVIFLSVLIFVIVALINFNNVSAAACGNKYCEIGEDINNCPEDCRCSVPVDVVLTMDISGSMGTNNNVKIIAAINAAKNFVDLLNNSKDKVGLVSFGDDAIIDQILTFDYSTVKTKIDSLNKDLDEARTQMGGGFAVSDNEIKYNGRRDIRHIIIILSDGMPTKDGSGTGCPDGPTVNNTCTDYAFQEAANAKNNGAIIYTIGLGINTSTPVGVFATNLLKSVASSPDYYYKAPTAADLQTVYSKLVGIICPYYKKCIPPDQTILRLSASSNAHGELWNGAGDYGWEICYNEIFGVGGNGDRTCHSNKVVGLDASTNAHAENVSLTNYQTNVCYGDLICTTRLNSCNADEKCVVTLSANTNAHLADCNSSDAYSTKICCKPLVIVIPALTSAYWTNNAGSVITTAGIGDSVKLVAEGTPDGTNITFEVFDSNPVTDSPIRTGVNALSAIISGGKATASTTITPADYNAGSGTRDFYFIASVVSNHNINISSGNLEITPPSECSCSDGTTCKDCSITGQYCNDTRSLVDDCIKCPCPAGAECIEGTNCLLSENTTIFTCENYTDQASCLNYNMSVAKYTFETYYGRGADFCGSPSSYQPRADCISNITCKCAWDPIKNCTGNYTDDYSCDNGDHGTRSCSLSSVILKNCSDPPVGTRIQNITDSCIGSSLLQTRCISRVELSFFSTVSLIVAIVIIIVFYWVVLRKEKKLAKRARK